MAAKPGPPALSLDGRAGEARPDRSGRTWSSKRSSANSSGSHETSERLDHPERGRELGLRTALPAQLELVLCRQSSASKLLPGSIPVRRRSLATPSDVIAA